MPDPTPTPIVSPVLALLRSRKFLLATLGVLLDLAIVLVPPDVAPRIVAHRDELLGAVTLLIGLLIGGITVEDVAQTQADAKVEAAQAQAQAAARSTEQTLKPRSGGDWQS